MKDAIKYWGGKLLKEAKKLIINSVIYTIREIAVNFVEENFIKSPVKKILSINKRWGFEDEEFSF